MTQAKTRGRVVTRAVLRSLEVAGAAGSVIVAPNMAQVIGKYLHHLDEKDARRTLHYLKYHKLIEVRSVNGREEYRLKDPGFLRYKKIILTELAIAIPRSWDKKWRVVVFDIPKYKQQQRNEFLLHLKRLGFYMLQRSVGVYPFECKEQIGVLLYSLDLEKEVSYMVVSDGDFTAHAELLFKNKGLLI